MIKICHLYGDILNTNGSRGNLDCLCRRLEWRGLEYCVASANAGGSFDLTRFDLIYIGAGHGEPPEALLADISGHATELQAHALAGGVILAVCEGFELLGGELVYKDGSSHRGAGVLDMTVRYTNERLTGNFLGDCGGDVGTIAAFRNQSCRVTLGPAVSPLCLLADGTTDGARFKNVFGSHGHGPLLPKNPRLADAVLAHISDAPLTALNDALENAAHSYMERKLS